MDDLVRTVEWLIAHDSDAQRIAQRSSEWIRRYLRLEVNLL
jgi:spore maturation protein CgeB